MKIRIIICLLIVISVYWGCNQISKNDLNGIWKNNLGDCSIYAIKFQEDSVKIEDECSFIESGVFSLEENKLSIKLNSGRVIETNVKLSDKDELLIFDNKVFCKYDYDDLFDSEEYNLLGLNICNKNPDSLWLYYYIHFYRTHENILRIRLNDSFKEYKDIDEFLDYHSSTPPKVAIYIGKGITKFDLKRMYKELSKQQIQKVDLIFNKSGLSEDVIIEDSIGLWIDENSNSSLKEIFLQKLPIIINKKNE